MKAIIVDIDGTLANVQHRLHHLDSDPKDWVAFHDAMVDDKPIEAIAWLIRTLTDSEGWSKRVGSVPSNEFRILVVSARHEDYRTQTATWLKQYISKWGAACYDKLYMRSNDDRRSDDIVKEEILEQIIADGYEPFLVVDDRPDVCDMWASYGITVLQARYEDRAKVQGKVLLTLLVGPSGAGKSTYAAKRYPSGSVISSDKIREQEGLGHTQDDLALTFKLARGYAKARIDAGLPAVIDATNLKKKDRLAFARLVPKGALIEYVLIDRDYDQKVADRGWRPVELIDKHHRMFRDTTVGEIKSYADGLPNLIVIDAR